MITDIMEEPECGQCGKLMTFYKALRVSVFYCRACFKLSDRALLEIAHDYDSNTTFKVLTRLGIIGYREWSDPEFKPKQRGTIPLADGKLIETKAS